MMQRNAPAENHQPQDPTAHGPTVVVSAARSTLDSDAGRSTAHWATDALLRAIIAADGVPIITAVGLPDDAAATVIDRADALVLTGGEDLSSYGSPYRPGCTDPERDRSEHALLRAARTRQIPILGICRGMQLLAVTAGGRLTPVDRHRGRTERPVATHRVHLAAGSTVADALGATLDVNSLHSFAIEATGQLRAVAWTADGGIEAVERDSTWEVGVQWHPELPPTATSRPLWRALVDEARRHRSRATDTRATETAVAG